MNTFTFKPSPLALMNLRLWFVKREITRKVALLKKKPTAVQKIYSEMLYAKTHSLEKKVLELYEHFKISNFRSSDETDAGLYQLMFVHYFLYVEWRHYDLRLKVEKEELEKKQNKVRRLLPSWIRSDEWRKSYKSQYEKEDWKYSWLGSDFDPEGDTVVDGIFTTWYKILTGMFVIGFLGIPFLYAMLYSNNILYAIANFLVGISKATGFSFPEVYAAFGYAIWILLFVFSSFAIVYKTSMNNTGAFNSIAESDRHTQERLADLAFMIEHSISNGHHPPSDPGPCEEDK